MQQTATSKRTGLLAVVMSALAALVLALALVPSAAWATVYGEVEEETEESTEEDTTEDLSDSTAFDSGATQESNEQLVIYIYKGSAGNVRYTDYIVTTTVVTDADGNQTTSQSIAKGENKKVLVEDEDEDGVADLVIEGDLEANIIVAADVTLEIDGTLTGGSAITFGDYTLGSVITIANDDVTDAAAEALTDVSFVSTSDEDPVLNLTGDGTITGGTGDDLGYDKGVYGGGINVMQGTTLNMYGTTITGNTANQGGGVMVSGTANFYDGSIEGNTAANVVTATLTTYDQDGNVVEVEYTYESEAAYGGGVYSSVNGTSNFYGTDVTGNSAVDNGSAGAFGGGVYASGTATQYNGTISGNSVSSTSGDALGTNVYSGGPDCSFEIEGAELADEQWMAMEELEDESGYVDVWYDVKIVDGTEATCYDYGTSAYASYAVYDETVAGDYTYGYLGVVEFTANTATDEDGNEYADGTYDDDQDWDVADFVDVEDTVYTPLDAKPENDIEPLKHLGSITKVEASDATCTEDGNEEYYICSLCGTVWVDDGNGSTTILIKDSEGNETEIDYASVSSLEDVTIPATGHSYINEDGSVNATDYSIENETITFTCTVCGESTEYPAEVSYSVVDGVRYVTISTTEPEEASFTEETGMFFDVMDSSKYYFDAVYALTDNGVIYGYTDGFFGVGDTMTRGQLVSMLYRYEGEPEVTTEASFSDVSDSAYYATAIDWAAENGIVDGYGDGTFGPDDAVTFEQFCKILASYLADGSENVTADTSVLDEFSDADDISSWAEVYVAYCVENGLVSGYSNGTIAPSELVTRERAATVLARAFGLI